MPLLRCALLVTALLLAAPPSHTLWPCAATTKPRAARKPAALTKKSTAPQKSPAKKLPTPPPAPAPSPVDYTKDLVPILEAQCVKCHNSNMLQAGLDVSTYEALMKGGNSGSPILPKRSADSLLYLYITGARQPQMPVDGSLPQKDLDLIARWIDEGALPKPKSPAPPTKP